MSDLDSLMGQIELINAKNPDELTSEDIDTLIFYHRRNRERKAAGGKPLKPTVDLGPIMKTLKPEAPKITRRI